MSVAFSTAGRVPFRVTITPTQTALARFSRAMFRSDGRVSNSTVGETSNLPWVAVIWLKTTAVPLFENICLPLGFELMSNQEAVGPSPFVPRDSAPVE